jgi:protein-L-isoaspartate(D-aspartate) O-methyltransferase
MLIRWLWCSASTSAFLSVQHPHLFKQRWFHAQQRSWSLVSRTRRTLCLDLRLRRLLEANRTLRLVGSVLGGLALVLHTGAPPVLRGSDHHATGSLGFVVKRARNMAWRASGHTNAELVHNLKRLGLIESPVVEKAFLAVDRKYFVPVGRPASVSLSTPSTSGQQQQQQQHMEPSASATAQVREASAPQPPAANAPLGVFPGRQHEERDEFAQNDPYEDSPQYIGYYATISAPHIQAMCAELLRSHIGRPGARVLDVGSGTGYLTAIFAKLGEFTLQLSDATEDIAAPTPATTRALLPRVFGIDHVRPLVEASLQNIRLSNPELIDEQRVAFKADDGRLGWPEYAPFDAIHVGAAADVVPRALLEQLKPGGRMVIPIGPEGGDQKLVAIDRDETDPSKYIQKDITGVRYVPLCDLAYQWQGALNADTEEEEKL